MPIYLYVKTHNKTGLKYLGKTISKDPGKYKGSGKYWINHIAKHGYDVTTEIIKECNDNTELKFWGQYYSNLWNIVESNEWANLKIENGDGGATPNGGIHMRLPEHKLRFTGDNNHMSKPEYRKLMKDNNPMNLHENRDKISIKLSGKSKSIEQKKNMYNPMLDPTISQKRAGKLNPTYDHNLYHFKNTITNCEDCLTQSDFSKKYSVNRGNVSSLIHGRAKSVKSWILLENL